MKVRFTGRCAGGCGRLLVVGALAERRHRNLWCHRCYAVHRNRCGRCTEQDESKALVTAGSSEPGLW